MDQSRLARSLDENDRVRDNERFSACFFGRLTAVPATCSYEETTPFKILLALVYVVGSKRDLVILGSSGICC